MDEIKKSTFNETEKELPVEQIKKKVMCDLCGKNFKSKSNLSKHVKTLHLQLNKKDCDSCNKTFRDANSLKIHIATIHDKKGISICEVCDKTFTSKKILKIHVNTIHGNTNESKDKLDQIKLEKSFMDEINNSTVKEVVEKPPQYQIKSQMICNLCGKNFNSKSNLSRHVKTLHLRMDKKDCESCNKTFSDFHSLKRRIDSICAKRAKCAKSANSNKIVNF